MIPLRSVTKLQPHEPSDLYPFNVPAINALVRLQFDSPVTFFVGENGSGKSTLLEGIAAAANAIVVGAEDIVRDGTLEHARQLANRLRISWSKKTRRGFFMRAEDFFNYTKRVNRMNQELRDLESDFETNLKGYGLLLAKSSAKGQRAALTKRYGDNADGLSHGESFLNLLQTRLVPSGLYLLDEPEGPLSPLRQLSLIALIRTMLQQDTQFIIATHSPILLAFPGATIFSFDAIPPQVTDYHNLEHVTLTKAFLNNPQAFLKHI
ncbi:ABC transporter ATP-binding protein [Nitrospira sp. KM1]|uniref:AAA family ATPase n=1 Tax=Nitrospira sp. KM1 TaxID=1936990 RepID=UPI0013A7A262|nr:AAA family ATPase [Nitrospira sp. KM1]BCA55092.1 ABC transporter ATP-binding protein [Nitrospira sp. KM1]